MAKKPDLHEKTEENDLPEAEMTGEEKTASSRSDRITTSITAFFRNPRFLRIAMLVVTFIVVVLIVWGVGMLIVKAKDTTAEVDPIPTGTTATLPVGVSTPEFSTEGMAAGLIRMPEMQITITPEVETRTEMFTYIVEQGDTIYGIAERFGLAPESVLWTNYYTLGETPDGLSIGQSLDIYPIDGTVYKWYEGDGLNGVSEFFGVTPEDIINYPSNNLDPETLGDYSSPNIEPGTMLFVPGGRRPTVAWVQARDSETSGSSYLGDGACTVSIYSQSGTGTFTWPTTATWLSGYDYTPPTHNGLDFDGDFGSPIYASDAGVIVYSGWSHVGYGNLIVVDHDNGWQTFYAHLMDGTMLPCGTNVQKGELIAAMGSTGNSTGPHLHFEIRLNGAAVNPWQYLQ
jgi:murein DD-endopeptidase MepM/ murein hydrolase activator NlpD